MKTEVRSGTSDCANNQNAEPGLRPRLRSMCSVDRRVDKARHAARSSAPQRSDTRDVRNGQIDVRNTLYTGFTAKIREPNNRFLLKVVKGICLRFFAKNTFSGELFTENDLAAWCTKENQFSSSFTRTTARRALRRLVVSHRRPRHELSSCT